MTSAAIIILYNLEDCINKQLFLLRKYCHATARIVIDNSSENYPVERSSTIRYWCDKHGAQYIRAHCTEYDPSMSHAFACNLAWTEFGDRYDIVWLLDHDVFLVKPLDLRVLMETKKIAGLKQVRNSQSNDPLYYYWPGMVVLNNTKINHKDVDFYPCAVDGVRLDTGGGLYHLIKGFGKNDMLDFDEQYVKNRLYNKHFENSYSVLNGGMFMHFRNGSNWKQLSQADHVERMSTLNALLDEYIVHAEKEYK